MELSSNAMITKPNPRKQRKPPLSQEQQKEQRPRLLAWQQQHYHSSPSCLLLLLTQKTKNPKGGPRVFPFAHPNPRGDSNPPSMIDNSKIITQQTFQEEGKQQTPQTPPQNKKKAQYEGTSTRARHPKGPHSSIAQCSYMFTFLS